MTCGKRSFETDVEAKEAMRQVPVKLDGQVPFRTYKCPICKKYHYTSKQEMKRRK